MCGAFCVVRGTDLFSAAMTSLEGDVPPPILWTPPADVATTTEIGRFVRWLAEERGREFSNYSALWAWSVDDLEGFWGSIWDFFGVRSSARYERVLGADAMPGARWFPGARLNYAEHLLGLEGDGDSVAVDAYSQTRPPVRLTFAELRDQVARAREGLKQLGVGRGDRVVAYLPNVPETLVAFAAAASLGAIWASCAPELGARSVIDRLGQLEPTVLFAVAGYGFRDRTIDRRSEVAEIRNALPSLKHVIEVPYGSGSLPGALEWGEFLREPKPLEFEQVAFDHPLYVLFSSGTTGLPKAIVHCHGGILLEHLKSHALSWDLKPAGRLLWFTTTTWMMWNALVSALLLRASIVMIDGDPGWPALDWQWQLAAETRPTVMGLSPAFLSACREAGQRPATDQDLSSIRVIATAGSRLPPEAYRYVYEEISSSVLLVNGSGGTDVCGAVVGGSPWQRVYEGEIAGACLGVAAHAFDAGGHDLVGGLGELVITRPMPSMPTGFWGDGDGARFHAAYFEDIPGVWRHGDWVMFTERGTCVVAGRSDATLNRGGVRLGTAEFYTVVEEFPEVSDSLVVHLEDADGGAGELILFVVLEPGADLDELRVRFARELRSQLSPRHVPDAVVAVAAIPRTLTGKKLEAPVKKILLGAAPDAVVSPGALVDPAAVEAFVAYFRASPRSQDPAAEPRSP
jgi:acetoacetyl-CoA synthetase